MVKVEIKCTENGPNLVIKDGSVDVVDLIPSPFVMELAKIGFKAETKELTVLD